jgi:hypothetical protein
MALPDLDRHGLQVTTSMTFRAMLFLLKYDLSSSG